MAWVTEEEYQAAKQVRAYEYLQTYQPGRLKKTRTRNEWQLQDHDSFKINEITSKWHWKSRDIGGMSALRFLMQVDGMGYSCEWTFAGLSPRSSEGDNDTNFFPEGRGWTLSCNQQDFQEICERCKARHPPVMFPTIDVVWQPGSRGQIRYQRKEETIRNQRRVCR